MIRLRITWAGGLGFRNSLTYHKRKRPMSLSAKVGRQAV